MSWIFWIIIGVLSIVGGVVALGNPFAATLTANLLTGWMFMLIGVLTVFSAFADKGWGARILTLLLGILLAVFGFNLVANPLQGIVQLTLIVAILMLVMGLFRIVIALSPMAEGYRAVLIISGLVSVALAAMIFSNFPQSAAVILGIFLAIELISNGVFLIFLGLERRKSNQESAV